MGKRSRKRTPRSKMAPKAAELVGAGWSRRDAEHLLVVELALSSVPTIGPEAGAVLAWHAATALAWEPVHCGAYTMYTDAEHAAAWRALAGYAEGPMRTVMLELAAYADGASVETPRRQRCLPPRTCG